MLTGEFSSRGIGTQIPYGNPLSVEDNGIGIPDEHMDRIFGRFYRVEAARFSEGTGLGLAMVKDIAKYHRGTIEVASVVEKGSKFTIKFSV